jgi:hypothetical protein
MRRWQISILAGLVITGVLAVVATFINSINVVRGVFWQCSILGYRSCPPNEFCEGTIIDSLHGVICIVLGVPIYALLTYLVLWLVAKTRHRKGTDKVRLTQS